MIISEKIYDILEKRGMTPFQLSQMTGIAPSTISDWKHKKTNPSADKLMSICHALEISPYSLLEEEDIGDYISEKLLLDTFRNSDEAAQKRIMAYIKELSQL